MDEKGKVRCKMVCHYKGDDSPSGNTRLILTPVIGDSEENKKFFAATPGGNIDLQVVSKEVAGIFEPGKEYYVDFIPVN